MAVTLSNEEKAQALLLAEILDSMVPFGCEDNVALLGFELAMMRRLEGVAAPDDTLEEVHNIAESMRPTPEEEDEE